MNKTANAGDCLYPDPLWNSTEQAKNRLAVPTKILGIKRVTCQTGVMYQVQTNGGSKCWLDSGWFKLN